MKGVMKADNSWLA